MVPAGELRSFQLPSPAFEPRPFIEPDQQAIKEI